jgi:glycosyltransferase 2 family protein
VSEGDVPQDHRAIAGDPDQPIASDPMESAAGHHPAVRVGQLALADRLRQPRTILSILVPLAIIAVFVAINGSKMATVPGQIAGADLRLVAIAFVIFYAGFPMRGLRWAILLRGTGIRVSTRDSTEIIFLSWLVNCVVPAKLGDVYRAYLLKINSTASLSRTFGTVFIERVLDLIAIALLGIAAGLWSFRNGLPPPIQAVFATGLVVVAILAVGLFTMRNFGRRILKALPFPPRLLELYDRFEEGVFGAIALRQLPFLGGLTASIWMTEALRLFFVVQALAYADVQLGLSGVVFVALIGSLLTAVPFSPAGLGIVEAGLIGVLHLAYGVRLEEATAIALLDRVISVFSIIVLGSLGYLVSSKPRGLDAVASSGGTTTA